MFARTDRLLLRPGWIEDATALSAAIGDPVIARMMRHVPSPFGPAHAEAAIARQNAADLPDLLVFARTHGAPRLIGGVALDAAGPRRAELTFWLARPHWGLGYAGEAAAAMVGMAFEGLRIDTLVAEHFVDNPGAGRVLEKLGFVATGLQAARSSPGRAEPAACVQYRLTNSGRRSQDPEPLAA